MEGRSSLGNVRRGEERPGSCLRGRRARRRRGWTLDSWGPLALWHQAGYSPLGASCPSSGKWKPVTYQVVGVKQLEERGRFGVHWTDFP